MSQITSCPSCGTRFRVVTDQLRISDGWVRCGQCQEVFDARLHMDEAPAPTPVAPPAPAPAPSAIASPAKPSAPALVSAAAALRAPPPLERAAPALPASGYELPVPHLGEDIDFSQYQTAESVADGHLPERMPFELDLEGRFAVPAVEDPWTAEPVASPSRAEADAAGMRTEPAWETAAPPAAPASGFPALDLSILQVPAYVPPAASQAQPVSGLQGNGPQSAAHEHDVLHKDEQKIGAAEPYSATGAVVMPAALPPTTPVEEPAQAEAGMQDALESAAQKLAQADPSAVPIPPPWPADASATLAFDDLSAEAQGLDSSLEPGFVREARRKAWWQKPVVRVAMGAGVVVLPVALALQVALHERNALVAWQPSVRPALEFMCTALRCQLAPRQQIAAMVVSGSAFTQGTQERSYQLSLSIQNKARAPVGMPAVELTLTDAQDQVIARKTILPKELGAPPELKAGAEWSGAVPVSTQGLNLQVSGYRVLLFYP